VKTQPFPSHCDLAVVGAGWGGAYLAYRLAVDTKTVDASKVCVFEANGRVGGRIFSVHDLPHFGDLAIDVGGYRFQEVQKLPGDLVFNALKLPTACYDWDCAASCEGTTCYVIKDAYGNNRGYATAIETMLGEVEDAGAGTQVYFGARLTGVYAAAGAAPASGAATKAVRLAFASGESVTADKVMLNLPGNAVEQLVEAPRSASGAAWKLAVASGARLSVCSGRGSPTLTPLPHFDPPGGGPRPQVGALHRRLGQDAKVPRAGVGLPHDQGLRVVRRRVVVLQARLHGGLLWRGRQCLGQLVPPLPARRPAPTPDAQVGLLLSLLLTRSGPVAAQPQRHGAPSRPLPRRPAALHGGARHGGAPRLLG
jgi:hypothetical protein